MGEYSDPHAQPSGHRSAEAPMRRFPPLGALYRPSTSVGSARCRALHPVGMTTSGGHDWGRKPGNWGWAPHFQAQCWTHWPAPFTAVPRALSARRQPAHPVPLDAHRLRRPGGLLGFRRYAPPPEQVAPGLRPGGRGLRPPGSKPASGEAWARGSALDARHFVGPFDRRPPSLCPLRAGRTSRSEGFRRSAAPTAAPHVHRCARWPWLPALIIPESPHTSRQLQTREKGLARSGHCASRPVDLRSPSLYSAWKPSCPMPQHQQKTFPLTPGDGLLG